MMFSWRQNLIFLIFASVVRKQLVIMMDRTWSVGIEVENNSLSGYIRKDKKKYFVCYISLLYIYFVRLYLYLDVMMCFTLYTSFWRFCIFVLNYINSFNQLHMNEVSSVLNRTCISFTNNFIAFVEFNFYNTVLVDCIFCFFFLHLCLHYVIITFIFTLKD